MAFCTKCGAKLGGNEAFCPKCGIKTKTSEKQEQPAPSKKNKKQSVFEEGKVIEIPWTRILTILLIIAVVVFAINLGSKYFNNNQNSGYNSVKAKPDNIINNVLDSSRCGDDNCNRGEDSSNCCMDCGCPSGYSCDGNSCKKLAKCGNGVVEEGETSNNCCKDAGCPTGEDCIDNECILLKPEVEITMDFLAESPSVTYLRGSEEDTIRVKVTNKGNDIAKNIVVTLSSPDGYFSEKTIRFEKLIKGMTDLSSTDLDFSDKCLSVTTLDKMTVVAKASYENSANVGYKSDTTDSFTIAGRNSMYWNKPEMISSWVTPTQPIISEFARKTTSGLPAGLEDSDPAIQKMAARWMFESIRAYGINYVNDAHTSGDYIQFPYETLKNKGGDCDDHAVIYASLLESIGLKSFLVLVPGHIFSGYINSKGQMVPIETTADDFDNALLYGVSQLQEYSDAEIIYPTDAWYDYPQVNLPESGTLGLPSITKRIEKECKLGWDWSEAAVLRSEVTFTNSGQEPGAGCAAMIAFEDGERKDDDLKCWTINPGETTTKDYSVDISLFGSGSCTVY